MSNVERIEKYKEARRHPKGPVKRLYTMQEAAFYLGRSVNALREMIWAGKLSFFRDGKRVLLDVRDLDEFIERGKQRFNF